jgi:hypothetical protein
LKVGDPADPVTGEGEDIEAGPLADAASGGTEVAGDGMVTVGSLRHEVVAPAQSADDGEEAGCAG